MTMVISGDGTITGLSAGGLPDATITQAELATGVAGTGPAFSAYQSSAQTLSSATATKLQFQTEEWDTSSCFNNTGSTVGSTPAYAFLPTVAGYYQVNAALQHIATGITYIILYKNGTAFKYSNYTGVAGVSPLPTLSSLVYCNGTTDYLEIYAISSVSGGTTNANSLTTYFQASMVRAA